MKSDLKWMLLGIFLALASCWFLILTAGGGDGFLTMVAIALPIAAVIAFVRGFTGADGPKSRESNEYPGDPEDTEPQEKSE